MFLGLGFGAPRMENQTDKNMGSCMEARAI